MMSGTPLVDPASVVLVSGGARGITARCVVHLAERTGCRFILLGRTPLADEPEWAAGMTEEAALKRILLERLSAAGAKPAPQKIQRAYREIVAQREIRATLAAVRQAGGDAEYLSVDITDGAALRVGVAAAADRLGPVTGIIHAAGNLADKVIEKKTLEDFRSVYTPKVDGLHNLLESVPVDQLAFLVLFSSVAGFYGNAGQADYAIANEVLNKAAHLVKRRVPGLRVISINWGPWDGGMVTPELKKAFAERDVLVIPVEQGAQMLVDELTASQADAAQVVVGGPLSRPPIPLAERMLAYQVHRKLSLADNPFLHDHAIGGNPVLPATCAASWIASAAEQLYPGYTAFRLENYRVLKGIVFDETLAGEYTLDLKEAAKSAAGGVALDAQITSPNANRRPFYHYSARVHLAQRPPAAPQLPLVGFEPDPAAAPIAGAKLYQDGTLFHGPVFQGVEQVLHLTPQGLTMLTHLPHVDERVQGQFPVVTTNPYILDAVVQCLLIWSQRYDQAPCLPSRLEVFEQYRPIPFGATLCVTMQVRSHSESSVVGDILVQDRSGRLYARIDGLEGTISRHLARLMTGARLTNA